MSYQYLKLDIDAEVGTLVLNRPPGNLLGIDMLEELNEAVLSLRAHRNLEVLVIRGTPDVFSEGLDLAEHVAPTLQRLVHVYMRLFESLRMMDAIQIAAVEGRAWGAGFELTLNCNLFVAAESASFKLPETGYGVFPPIACAILPRVVPRRKAMEWILTGKELPAQRLEHFGLINVLLPVSEFEAGLTRFVTAITSKSKPVMKLAKRAQLESYYATFPEAMSRVQSLYLRDLMELTDSHTGPEAFVAGTAPEWVNR